MAKQELIVPYLGNLTPAAVYADVGELDKIVEDIRKACDGVVFDMETKKGQNECRSFAFRITRSRTLLDDLGKDYASDLRKRLKTIDGQRKEMRENLDNLRDDIRAPLTELEEAEKALQAKIDQRIEDLKVPLWPYESEAIQTKLTALKATELDKADYGARFKEAQAVLKQHIDNGEKALAHATERDAAEAKAAEEAAEAQRIREEQIAEQARQDAIAEQEAKQAEIVETAKAEERERIGREAREVRESLEASLLAEIMAPIEEITADQAVENVRQLHKKIQATDYPEEVTLTENGFTPNSQIPTVGHHHPGDLNHAMQTTVDELVKQYGNREMFEQIVSDVADGQYFYLRLDV